MGAPAVRLDAEVVDAVERGDELELLELGLAPELVWPELARGAGADPPPVRASTMPGE